MLNSKLIKSKSFHIVMLGALVAQTSVQAYSVADCIAAGKEAVQTSLEFAKTTATQIANSEFVGTAKEYVQTKAESVMEVINNNPKMSGFTAGYFTVLGLLVVADHLDQANRRAENERWHEYYKAERAKEEARIAQAQAHIDALSFDDFLKLVNAHVIEAQQLFNEANGPRILELNIARYNYELSEEEMNAIVQELTFVCAAQSNNSYSLVQAEELLEKALAIMTRRTEQRGATDLGMCDRTAKFIQEIKEVRTLINEFAALYQDQVSADFNQKVTEYRTQNPIEQVTLIAHNCGNNCLKSLSCECSGCACTAQTDVQS